MRACIIITGDIQYDTADKNKEQRALVTQAGQLGTRMCGPNCEGIIYLRGAKGKGNCQSARINRQYHHTGQYLQYSDFGIGYWPETVYPDMLEALGRLYKIARDHAKLILPVFTTISTGTHGDLLSRAAELKLPIYLIPEAAVASARALVDYAEA